MKNAVKPLKNLSGVIRGKALQNLIFVERNKAYILSFTVNLMPRKGAVV